MLTAGVSAYDMKTKLGIQGMKKATRNQKANLRFLCPAVRKKSPLTSPLSLVEEFNCSDELQDLQRVGSPFLTAVG